MRLSTDRATSSSGQPVLVDEAGQVCDLVSPAQAAAFLGLSLRQVQAHCQTGALPATKPSRDWVIRAADLVSFKPPPRGRRWKKLTPG